jgi:hypothetical protein
MKDFEKIHAKLIELIDRGIIPRDKPLLAIAARPARHSLVYLKKDIYINALDT